ncbi:amidase domain-containing protein [Aciduricibacillus chroicocephali]|uniref:Amidase domain-containing protein n=1 Tax=Aciduricibacillus chroicocephali TaxID=3054939 RepID=A0ABY9L0Y4_9BACI|nr:amidase domain-containing protein [Bacillaceae bacterium 44XB]
MEEIRTYWTDLFAGYTKEDWLERKKELFSRRQAEILKISGRGHVYEIMQRDGEDHGSYNLHLSYFIRQGDCFYIEEQLLPMQFTLKGGKLSKHEEADKGSIETFTPPPAPFERKDGLRAPEQPYNRLAAVQYAERWWNDFNPQYHRFHNDDCTNYISQCLFAGGAKMWGSPNRSRGWWYSGKSWSYSWAVAHSFRWYLSGTYQGLKTKEVESPQELVPGDIICYDFQGNGKFDHNTIVVNKDAEGMPLVNAHTNNSRNRYWAYQDSAAWTPNCQYKFFHILSV